MKANIEINVYKCGNLYEVTQNYFRPHLCLEPKKGKLKKVKEAQAKELDPRIKAIAGKLEQVRIEKGYTSYENFAIEHGISRMQYWRMEKGSNFTFASFLKILDAHGMSLSEFFKEFNGKRDERQ